MQEKGVFFLMKKKSFSSKVKDLTGQHFGRLTVISYAGTNKYNRSMWNCVCSCGNRKVVDSNSLQKGATRSCGCLDREAHITSPNRKTHGKHNTRLYRIWKAMKNRCFNANTNDFQKWYGGRGIVVCDEWKNNFQAFYDWAINNGYSDNLSIDRINVDGNYEPSNCRWATAAEQAHNKRGGGSHQKS